jgi:hypothetical protein
LDAKKKKKKVMDPCCLLYALPKYPKITYYWTVPLILDHSYLVGNLKNSKIDETKPLESVKS